MLNRHEADCKRHVSGTGHWKDGRDGREYALCEFLEKGRSNRQGLLGKRWFVLCFEDGKNGRDWGLEGKYFN